MIIIIIIDRAVDAIKLLCSYHKVKKEWFLINSKSSYLYSYDNSEIQAESARWIKRSSLNMFEEKAMRLSGHSQ